MELVAGIEPATSSLPRKCSTTELHKQGGNRRGDRPALRKGKVGSLGELISCWIRPEIVSTTRVSLPHAFSHCVADCISPPPSVKRILGKNFREIFRGLHTHRHGLQMQWLPSFGRQNYIRRRRTRAKPVRASPAKPAPAGSGTGTRNPRISPPVKADE